MKEKKGKATKVITTLIMAVLFPWLFMLIWNYVNANILLIRVVTDINYWQSWCIVIAFNLLHSNITRSIDQIRETIEDISQRHSLTNEFMEAIKKEIKKP